MNDCIVAHPGVQHSTLCAAALLQVSRLQKLVTRLQIGSSPPFLWRSALRVPAVQRALELRTVSYLPDHFIERKQLVAEVVDRLAARNGATSLLNEWSVKSSSNFQRAVARSVDPTVNFVVGTDHRSLELFQEMAKAQSRAIRVLDLSHPPPEIVHRLILEDSRELGLPTGNYDDTPVPDARDHVQGELEAADVVLVASTFSANTCHVLGLPPEKVHVVPYGFPSRPGSIRPSSPSTTLRLAFVGALSERKGFTLLMRAMEKLAKRGVPVRLSIVGSPASNLDISIPENVEILGRVSHQARDTVVADSHYLILPSMCEGFGRVLIEALALGTGVITTERSAGPDIKSLEPDAPVHIVPVEERSLLSDVLEEIQLEVSRQGIDRSSASQAARHFTLPAYGQRLDSVLDRELRRD